MHINIFTKRYNIYRIAIILLLGFVAAIFFYRCFVHELSEDEVKYEFRWEIDDNGYLGNENHRFDHKIKNIGDVIISQIQHYKYCNGRTLVHFAEQSFTGHMFIFSLINTAVFVIFILLISRITSQQWMTNQFSLWLCIILCLLLLFPLPNCLWTSVNFAPNYLWPSVMALIVLLIWKKYAHNHMNNKMRCICVILGFIFGWSHESFAIPVCCAQVLYIIILRKRFNQDLMWLFTPTWIGSAILFFAPGNFIRLQSSTFCAMNDPMYRIWNGINNLCQSKFIWLVIISSLLLIPTNNKKFLFRFIATNLQIFLVFIGSPASPCVNQI